MTKTKRVSKNLQCKDPDLPTDTYTEVLGVGGDVIGEKNHKFFRLLNEDVWSNNNSFIVLGRDRWGGPLTGYGGKGHPDASSIDIVVGRISCVMDEADLETKAVWSNPDFKNDAARIHISQKTDIDKNFDLPKGMVGQSTAFNDSGQPSAVRSGIAVKADSVRVIARSGIKLVSSCDTINSSGLSDTEMKGVDLIAGVPYTDEPSQQDLMKKLNRVKRRHDMQPIPKGDNLKEAFEDILIQIDSISSVLINFVKKQMEFNNHVNLHTHNENFYGYPTATPITLIEPNLQMNIGIFEEITKDIEEVKLKYLNYFRSEYLNDKKERYINSVFHHLN